MRLYQSGRKTVEIRDYIKNYIVMMGRGLRGGHISQDYNQGRIRMITMRTNYMNSEISIFQI